MMKATIYWSIITVFLLICGLLAPRFWLNSLSTTTIWVRPYAVNDFQEMVLSKPIELRNVTIRRQADSDLWDIRGRGSLLAERKSNRDLAVVSILEWGREAAKVHFAKEEGLELISYDGACVVH